MGLSGHAEQLYASGRRTADLPQMSDASPVMIRNVQINRDPEKMERLLDEMRALGYAN